MLLALALLGTLSGFDAIATGGTMTMSEARGWASIVTAAGLALVALGLPRVFRGELVVADDGIARRYRSRPWRWVPAELGQVVLIQEGRRGQALAVLSWWGEVRWTLVGWRLNQVRAALLAKGYEVSGP